VLLNLGVPLAAIAEAMFLVLYIWWAAGGGPPRAAQASRVTAFRRRHTSTGQTFAAGRAIRRPAITARRETGSFTQGPDRNGTPRLYHFRQYIALAVAVLDGLRLSNGVSGRYFFKFWGWATTCLMTWLTGTWRVRAANSRRCGSGGAVITIPPD